MKLKREHQQEKRQPRKRLQRKNKCIGRSHCLSENKHVVGAAWHAAQNLKNKK